MFCKQCGKEIMDGSTVCPNCGTAVGSAKVDVKGLNWCILGGAIVSVIATFMPAITFWGQSASFMEEATRTEGIGIIIVSLVAALLGYLPKTKIFSFIPALINLWVVWYDLSPALDYGAKMGIGAILIVVANIAIIVGAVLEFMKKKKN